MGLWYDLIPFLALLGSNLLIVKSISKYDSRGKVSLPALLSCVVVAFLYGIIFVLSRRVNPDLKIISYTVFFLNNLWMLVFFRSSIVTYNRDISLRKYFIFSMIAFISPVTLLITFFKFSDFSALAFSISYTLGLFPIVILTSLITGLSVKSRFWGIVLSCFLFTVDLVIRTGVVSIIPEDLRIPTSEVFRTLCILLVFLVVEFGSTLPRKEYEEVFQGTRKLNNAFFSLMAFFPVMIFFATFWQVNLNYREQQEKEIEISKEVFSLSLNIMESESEKLLSQVEDIIKSNTLSVAQWKLKSLQQLNPKVKTAQIISSAQVNPEGIRVDFMPNLAEITGAGTRAWIIKITLDLGELYSELPIDRLKQLYVLKDGDTIMYPPDAENGGNFRKSSKYKSFLESQSTDFGFKSTVNLLGYEFDAYLIFETSAPEMNMFTMMMMIGCIFLLVLIWSVYSYYIDRWEQNGRAYLKSFSESKNDYGNTIDKLESNLSVLSRDVRESENKIEQISNGFSSMTATLSRFDFQKGPEIELTDVFRKLERDFTWVNGFILLKKGSKGWEEKCRSYSGDGLPVIPQGITPGAQLVSTKMSSQSDSARAVLAAKKDFLLCCVYDTKKFSLNLQDRNLIYSTLDISTLYMEIYDSFSKNDQIMEKYRLISTMLLEIRENNGESPYMTEIVLKYTQKLFPDSIVCGSVYVKNDAPTFYWYKGKKFGNPVEYVSLNPDKYRQLMDEINSGSPLFVLNSTERKNFSENTRSAILLPVHSGTDEKYAIVLEFSDYKLFSSFEKELIFFFGKVLSDVYREKK